MRSTSHPVPDFPSHDKTDTSDKSPAQARLSPTQDPFVSSVSFVTASQLPGGALADEPDQLREWRAGMARIDRDRPPKGFPAKDWQALHQRRPSLPRYLGSDRPLALGWSTLDLFGVHRLAPAANYSAIGPGAPAPRLCRRRHDRRQRHDPARHRRPAHLHSAPRAPRGRAGVGVGAVLATLFRA